MNHLRDSTNEKNPDAYSPPNPDNKRNLANGDFDDYISKNKFLINQSVLFNRFNFSSTSVFKA